MHDCRIFSFALSESSAVHTDHGGSKIRSFPDVFFSAGWTRREGIRIASRIPCPSRRHREYTAKTSFPTFRRILRSDLSLPLWQGVISLFASLRNFVYRKQRNWGESRIPFQRESNYRRWSRVQTRARAHAFKPLLRRELLIRFSQPDFARLYKVHHLLQNIIYTRRHITFPHPTSITDLLNVLHCRCLFVLILQCYRKIVTFPLLNNLRHCYKLL